MEQSHVSHHSSRAIVRCQPGADADLGAYLRAVTEKLRVLNPQTEALAISLPKDDEVGASHELLVVAHLGESDGQSFFSLHDGPPNLLAREQINPTQLGQGVDYAANTIANVRGHKIEFPGVRDPDNIFDDIDEDNDLTDDLTDLTLPCDPEEVRKERELMEGCPSYPSPKIHPDISSQAFSHGECITLTSIGFNRSNPGQDIVHIQENENRAAVVFAVLDGHQELGKEAARVVSEDFSGHFARGYRTEDALCAVFPDDERGAVSPSFISLRNKQTVDKQRGGTTWVSAEIVGAQATFLSAGDSWAAVFRRGEDRSFALVMQTKRENEYFRKIQEEGSYTGRPNVLYNSLQPGDHSVAAKLRRYEPVTLEPGDIVLLASDGIDVLHPQHLIGLLGMNNDLSTIVEALDRELSWLSQKVFAMDDVSLILFRYDGEGEVVR